MRRLVHPQNLAQATKFARIARLFVSPPGIKHVSGMPSYGEEAGQR